MIETSGVSRPLPVAALIESERFRDRLRLDGVYCLVDAAEFATLDFASTELAIDQAVASDLVVFNKTDLADAASVAAAEQTLRAAMPRLRSLHTQRAAVPREVLFSGTAITHGHDHDHDHDHHHDHPHDPHRDHGWEDWTVWHWRDPRPVTLAGLRRALRSLPAGVLRAKGIVHGQPGERIVFQVVGKRLELVAEAGDAPESTAIAIGRRDAFDPAALTALFDAC